MTAAINASLVLIGVPQSPVRRILSPWSRPAGPTSRPSDSHLPLPALWPGGSLTVPGLPCGESETRWLATLQGRNLRELVRARARDHPAPAGGRPSYVRAGAGGGALAGCMMSPPARALKPDILVVPPAIQITAPLVLSDEGHQGGEGAWHA